mmetsp:Transcript_172495/g.552924  ORF Transcript_172495/g.552924 Transcript_172495/m.552924 type:complete len:311 (-) Transcript_172495:332-1264(-)
MAPQVKLELLVLQNGAPSRIVGVRVAARIRPPVVVQVQVAGWVSDHEPNIQILAETKLLRDILGCAQLRRLQVGGESIPVQGLTASRVTHQQNFLQLRILGRVVGQIHQKLVDDRKAGDHGSVSGSYIRVAAGHPAAPRLAAVPPHIARYGLIDRVVPLQDDQQRLLERVLFLRQHEILAGTKVIDGVAHSAVEDENHEFGAAGFLLLDVCRAVIGHGRTTSECEATDPIDCDDAFDVGAKPAGGFRRGLRVALALVGVAELLLIVFVLVVVVENGQALLFAAQAHAFHQLSVPRLRQVRAVDQRHHKTF